MKMELPQDVIGEISKYAQPSLRQRTKLVSKNELRTSIEDKVHSYNLKTSTGIDLFNYIWMNSLDDEFMEIDWDAIFNEHSWIHISNEQVYLTNGQKNIVKELVTRYKYSGQRIFILPGHIYSLAALYQIMEFEDVHDEVKRNYIQGLLILDDPQYFDTIDKFYDDHNKGGEGVYQIDVKHEAISWGAYNYCIHKKYNLDEREYRQLLLSFYYTPDRKKELLELLKYVTAREYTAQLVTVRYEQQQHTYHDQKLKIILDKFYEDKVVQKYIIESYLDLYIDKLLADGVTYEIEYPNHTNLWCFRRVNDIETYKKYMKFFVNIRPSEYIYQIRSPVVYQHILDTEELIIKHHQYVNGYLLVLLRDHIFKHSKQFQISDFKIFDDVYEYYFMEDIATHYDKTIRYNYNTNLPRALKDYNGTDQSLLNILVNYEVYIDEGDDYVHAKIGRNYFAQALKLVQDPKKLIQDYYHGLIIQKRPFSVCHNFIKEFILMYPDVETDLITKLIFDNKMVGLLELMKIDPDLVQLEIEKLANYLDFTETMYAEYLSDLIN